MKKKIRQYVYIFFILFSSSLNSISAQNFITIASTTSTEHSGLFNYILPIFTQKTDIGVRIIAVGTGKAIKLAERGDADILLVHHTPSENKFVKRGYGVKRFPVMFNDFVIVGPSDDPAKILKMRNVLDVLERISKMELVFLSRGDESGTNKIELSLWEKLSINVKKDSGTWYRETGNGMGATLNIASSMNGYTLTDRATWLSFKNKGSLKTLLEGDRRLHNQYGIIKVSPIKFPHTKSELAQEFIDWLISEHGQNSIQNYTINGMQAFFPNAKN